MLRELPDGYSAKYKHERQYTTFPAFLLPTGGKTTALILDAEKNIVAEGIAQCSLKDNFSRPLGRKIALERALQQLEQKRAIEFIEPAKH